MKLAMLGSLAIALSIMVMLRGSPSVPKTPAKIDAENPVLDGF
jgi:hypothetical protein